MRCTSAINMDDGRLAPIINGVNNPFYAPIPDDVAIAVDKGEIDWRDVVNAINKKRYQDKDFDWTELMKRKENENIRRTKFDLVNPDGEVETSSDDGIEPSVTIDELKSVKDPEIKRTRKTKTSEPASESESDISVTV